MEKRILIVEDHRDTAESLAELLSLHGHSVQIAPTAAQALDFAARSRPHVAIVDLMLPDMNGLDLAPLLRPLLHDEDSLLIASTGHGRREDVSRSTDAGFDAHFVKPVPLLRFLRAIEDA